MGRLLSNAAWTNLWRQITGSRQAALDIEPNPMLRPYLCFGDPRVFPDWYQALGVRRWMFELQTAAGGAGTFSHIFVVNPVGSGVVSVLDFYTVGKDSATAVFMGPRHRTNGVPPANPATAVFGNGATLIDQRFAKASVARATTQLWSLVDATGSYRAQNFDSIAGAGAAVPRRVPVVLGPGDAVVFDAETNNTIMDIVVAGYERDLQSGELGLNV